MQHDSKYPPRAHRDQDETSPEPTPAPAVQRVAGAIGSLLGWALIGLVGVLIASGLIVGIVALWRVIL